MFYYIDSKSNTFLKFDAIHETSLKPYPLYFQFSTQQQQTKKVTKKCLLQFKDKLYILATWENLFYLGSSKQKNIWNEFRLRIMHILLEKIQNTCKHNKCTYELVGTNDNITPASDIDVDLRFKDIKTIQVALHLTKEFEKTQLGGKSLDTMFDVNFYKTYFDMSWCTKSICYTPNSQYEQHQWAFLRFVQQLQLYPSYERLINFELYPSYLKKLYYDTIKKLDHMQKSTDNAFNLTETFYASKPNQRLDLFSRTKFFDHDAYLSAGAYLHIVGHHNDLPSSMYIDSILDNTGFLVSNLLKKTECTDIHIILLVLRVAKYMERICEAWMLYYGKNLNNQSVNIFELYNVVKHLNMLRKSSVKVTNKHIQPLLELTCKSATCTKSISTKTIFKGVIHTIFSMFPQAL